MRTPYLRDVEVDLRAQRLASVRQLLGRHDFVCGLTAARLYGVGARDPRSDLIWVGCPAGRRIRVREGCYLREVALEASDLDLLDGILLTTPLRTVYDCARWLAPVEGLVVAESFVRAGLVTSDDIVRYRGAHKGTRGVAAVDRMLGMLEPLSGSPMQTRVRCLLMDSGLPRPVAQYAVRDCGGGFVARVELAYIGLRLAIECGDGLDEDSESRHSALGEQGWTLLPVTAANLDAVPGLVAEHVRTAIESAA